MRPGRILAFLILIGGATAIIWSVADQPDRPERGDLTAAVAAAPTTSEAPEPIPVLGAADTLTDLDGWLNTELTSFEAVQASNEVTVVWFWTLSCFNCKNTIPYLQDLYADFGDKGLEIVGVHAPEFSYEREVDNIIEAAATLGVTWPIALDTEKRNFHRWQEGPTGYWPRFYLIDSEGQVRLERRGDSEAKYQLLYDHVGRLLAGET